MSLSSPRFFPEFFIVAFFACFAMLPIIVFIRLSLGQPVVLRSVPFRKPRASQPKFLATQARKQGHEYQQRYALPESARKASFMIVCVLYWVSLPFLCRNVLARWLMAGCVCCFSMKLGDMLYLRTVRELRQLTLADYIVEFVFFSYKEDVDWEKPLDARLRQLAVDLFTLAKQTLIIVACLCWQQAVYASAGIGPDRIVELPWGWRYATLVFSALFVFYNVIHFYLRLAATLASFFFGCRQHDGHYVMRSPWLATSPRELWAERWRHTLSHLYRATIFLPLVRRHNWDAGAAAMVVFLVSGFLHQFQNFAAFGNLFSALTFFFLHGLVCLLQSIAPASFASPLPIWLCQILTFTFNYSTAVLYFAPYFSGQPNFFHSFFQTLEPLIPLHFTSLIQNLHDSLLLIIP